MEELYSEQQNRRLINWKTDQKTLFTIQHREESQNTHKSHRWEPERVSWEFKFHKEREGVGEAMVNGSFQQ